MRNGITIFFEPELDERLKRFDAAVYSSMLADSAKVRIKEVVQSRCDQITEGVSRDIMVRLLGDENPLARYNSGLITNEDRKKYTRVVTEKLISGDISIPDRMTKLVEDIIDLRLPKGMGVSQVGERSTAIMSCSALRVPVFSTPTLAASSLTEGSGPVQMMSSMS